MRNVLVGKVKLVLSLIQIPAWYNAQPCVYIVKVVKSISISIGDAVFC